MKNSCKIAILFSIVALVGSMTACNDAKYDTLGMHAYVSESASNKTTKVTITVLGVDAEVTACLSEIASKDVKLKFVVDSKVLDRYNEKEATSYLVLPEDVYEMDAEVTIKAGQFSAPATKIHIKSLPEEYVSESYALPLRLVSVDGTVPVTSATSAYVITTDVLTISSLPMFTGGPILMADGFPMTLGQFTIEARFQVNNTAKRNRAIFTNCGSVLLRFEDPQNAGNGIAAHSMVQFQGEGWYLNPIYAFLPNKWQHLALTYDGSAVTLYVNGVFAGTKKDVVNPLFGSVAWFGGDAGGGHGTEKPTWWLNCKILCNELRIWSVCRTEAQIQNNMVTTSAMSQGLEAYWRMNEGVGNVFEDATGNGHVLRTASTATWIHDIKSTDTEVVWP